MLVPFTLIRLYAFFASVFATIVKVCSVVLFTDNGAGSAAFTHSKPTGNVQSSMVRIVKIEAIFFNNRPIILFLIFKLNTPFSLYDNYTIHKYIMKVTSFFDGMTLF